MDRHERLRRIQSLDPANDFHAIYREMVQFEFPEMELAFFLAFIRPFAVPAISRVTAHTGEITRDPRKRATDTAILLYTVFEYGFRHELGRKAIQRLNMVHRHWRATNTNDDYIYVLATLVVPPVRFLDRYGWRRTCCHERRATFHFYQELGRHMAIQGFPKSYEALELWFDDYERDHIYFDPANKELMDSMHRHVARQAPWILRWPVTRALDSLLDEPVRKAIGLTTPPMPIRAATSTALFLAAWRRRRSTSDDTPWFKFGQPFGSYAEPYELEHVGPGDQGEVARRFQQKSD